MRVSNVLSFSILRTEMDRISWGVKKVNSTLSSEEATGCEIFMLGVEFGGTPHYRRIVWPQLQQMARK